MRMHKRQLRCFAEFSDGLWVAYCLDFGLGAQGDTFHEAKLKLESQISDLSADEARSMLRQSSPPRLWARYWLIWGLVRAARLFGRESERRRRFTEAMPPALALC